MSFPALTLFRYAQHRTATSLQILPTPYHCNTFHYDYASVLRTCLQRKGVEDAKLVHAHIIRSSGFGNQAPSAWNILISMYAKHGSVSDAARLLRQMPRPSVVSWTSIISALVSRRSPHEALSVFAEMRNNSVKPDSFTFSTILSICSELTVVKQLHGDLIRQGSQLNPIVCNALVSAYGKTACLDYARQVFDKMPDRNIVSWNSMLAAYVQNSAMEEALRFFQQLPERNPVSWTTIVSGLARRGYINEASDLFNRMPRRSSVSWNAMLSGYAQHGLLDEAFKIFQEMPQKTVASWNAIIAGCAQNGQPAKALELYQSMKSSGFRPNSTTFSSVLPACASLAALEHAKRIHQDISRYDIHCNVFVNSALLHMYAKCGNLEDARRLFDEMPNKDVVCWSSMIEAYAIHGHAKEALQIFGDMQKSGTKPNEITFVGVLTACCHAGLVEEGIRLFDIMQKRYRISPKMEHYSCIVDLLGRAGMLEEAQLFISEMPMQPDFTIWRCLLSACRAHGNLELAQNIAKCLLEQDPENSSTYLQLGSLYATTGHWDGLRKIRKLMKERQVRKEPGCSWIEINGQFYAFVVGDSFGNETSVCNQGMG